MVMAQALRAYEERGKGDPCAVAPVDPVVISKLVTLAVAALCLHRQDALQIPQLNSEAGSSPSCISRASSLAA